MLVFQLRHNREHIVVPFLSFRGAFALVVVRHRARVCDDGHAPANLFKGVGIRRLGFRIPNSVDVAIFSSTFRVRRVVFDGPSNAPGRRVPVVADVIVGEVISR